MRTLWVWRQGSGASGVPGWPSAAESQWTHRLAVIRPPLAKGAWALSSVHLAVGNMILMTMCAKVVWRARHLLRSLRGSMSRVMLWAMCERERLHWLRERRREWRRQ